MSGFVAWGFWRLDKGLVSGVRAQEEEGEGGLVILDLEDQFIGVH